MPATTRKPAKPAKLAPVDDDAAPEINLDPYTFTGPDGVEYTIPSFGSCPAGVIRRARHMDDAGALFSILEALVDDGPELEAIDAMVGPEFAEFVDGWQSAAGVDLPN